MIEETKERPLVVFVDVDDTLVRSVGTKQIPISEAVEHVRALHAEGAELYCWSSGGGAYARSVAEGLGIAGCFVGFLPKPQVMLDDQPVEEWRRLVTVHPSQCGPGSVRGYREALAGGLKQVR